MRRARHFTAVWVAMVWEATLGARFALPAPKKPETPPKAPRQLVTFDQCLRVIEGDQIEGQTVGLIRLLGIIAPGPGEPGYQEAIDTTRRLVIGKSIKVEICPQRPNDYKDRLRAIVYLPDGTNLNTKLLRLGVARVLDHPPCHIDAKTWQVYEESARKAKRGIWAGGPEAPERAKRTSQPSERRARPRVRIRPVR